MGNDRINAFHYDNSLKTVQLNTCLTEALIIRTVSDFGNRRSHLRKKVFENFCLQRDWNVKPREKRDKA
jgi:hypothetical protein